MAIIYSYPLNDDIKLLDELVGTTEKNINGQLKTVTRNFLLTDLAEFFIVDGGLQKTITLTTIGNGGAATLDQITGILNIPEYAGLQNLQQVTDLGNVTSNSMRVESANSYSQINATNIGTESTVLSTYAYLRNNGSISIRSGAVESNIKNTVVTNLGVILEFPNKTSGSYTIATTSDVIAQNLQQVTNVGSTTTNSITANSFIKQDGTGANILLDDGSTIPLTDVGNQDLQSVLENGYTAYDQGIHLITNDIGSNILNLDVSTSDGTYKAIKVDYNYQNELGSTAVQFTSNGQLNVDEMTTGITLQSNNTSTGNAIEAYSLNGKSIVTYGEGTVAIESNLGTSGKGLVINSGTSSTGAPLTINKNGVDKLVVNQNGELTATKLIKEGGDGTNILLDNGNTLAVSAIPTVTPSALTKVDDTNVTVTLGGSPSTALLQGVSLTLGWTGTLADSRIASASTWNAKENVLTFSSPLSRSVNTVSMPAATTSVDGYLTSTNWNTFNNKENSLGNPAQDGYVLSSTTTGTRSWVAQAAGFEANFLLMGA